ncbi:cytosine permease [[Kitasatospora] papulosa]|uniref:cytosine permease n=1 Tax=[Kitasatospora] papulosa TaxID=1464011 RepID=UPI0036CEF89A
MENRGLDPVPDHERTDRVRTLFPTWVTANLTVLLLTVGAGLAVFNGLNLWQVLAVAVTASVLSFGLVGLVSVAGKQPPGPAAMMVAGVGTLVAGGLGWVPSAPDFARYLLRDGQMR